MTGVRNLILAGGIFHPFEETAPLVAQLLATDGIESDIEFDIEAGAARLAAGGYGLLTVHCLRWTMVQDEKYAPFRDRWALSLSGGARAAIREHVEGGGGLFGLHTACICFDDWPEWRDLLGVAWRWGRSHHPPLGPVEFRVAGRPHPVTAGIPPFQVEDEVYSDLELGDGAEMLGEARPAGGAWRPVAFAKQGPGGRRLYLGLGHDVASMAEPAHAELIRRGGAWAAGLAIGESLRLGETAR